jgi:hypothetical protein
MNKRKNIKRRRKSKYIIIIIISGGSFVGDLNEITYRSV